MQDKYCLNMKPYFIQGQILDKIDKCVQHHTNHISPHGDVFFTRVPPCMIYSVSLLCISREITLIWELFVWIKSVIFTKTA